jgi:trimethylamine-N-oxide reductase (cytochrome c)
VVPHYIQEKEGRYDPLAEKYPFQDLQAHPKFRFHGKFDDCEWLSENYKVYGPDGYPYEPAYINPADAAEYGLKDGDIIRAYNDRGGVLAGVQVTHRVMPKVIWLTYGAWNDPLEATPSMLDRSGDINSITNPDAMSVHHPGGAYNSTLVQIEKVDLDALAAQYPEGFAGKYSTWNWKG